MNNQQQNVANQPGNQNAVAGNLQGIAQNNVMPWGGMLGQAVGGGAVQGVGGGLAGHQGPVGNAMAASMADIVAFAKKRAFAKAEILEHIEAQMRMDLWKDEPLHKQIFEDAMHGALERINKL
jgi:hypothetical protein